jgi:hypothetical protein
MQINVKSGVVISANQTPLSPDAVRVDPVGMSELPGVSVFLRDRDRILHTYSTYTARSRHD